MNAAAKDRAAKISRIVAAARMPEQPVVKSPLNGGYSFLSPDGTYHRPKFFATADAASEWWEAATRKNDAALRAALEAATDEELESNAAYWDEVLARRARLGR